MLGLEFRLQRKHFKRGDMKIKCLATIATVYWKTNELSIEGERPYKAPVMESRETRAQGHTHAEHILGKSIAQMSYPRVILQYEYCTSYHLTKFTSAHFLLYSRFSHSFLEGGKKEKTIKMCQIVAFEIYIFQFFH